MGLFYVVRRPMGHRRPIDGQVPTAGEHDDWHRTVGPRGSLKQLDPGLGTKVVIEQANIPRTANQTRQPILPGRGPLQADAHRLNREGVVPGQHELVLVVVHEQDGNAVGGHGSFGSSTISNQ